MNRTVVTMIAALAAVSAFGDVTSLQGKTMPNFSFKDLSGKAWSNKTLKGKVYVLDFWATWCGPCKKASPVMEKLHKNFASKGLLVFGLEAPAGQPTGAKNYQAEHGYHYTFSANNDNLTAQFKIDAIPAFIVVGKDGKVARVDTGVPGVVDTMYTSYEKLVKGLLAK